MPSTTPLAISRERSPCSPVEAPEAERVEHADHLRSHAVDVAHDAADAGGRALERHHLGGMVVALVPHHQRPPLALEGGEVDDARVLAGADDDVRRLGGEKRLERPPARLVGAVLAPERVEEDRLRARGIAAQKRGHAAGLVGGQAKALPRESFAQRTVVGIGERHRRSRGQSSSPSTRSNTRPTLRRLYERSKMSSTSAALSASRMRGSSRTRSRNDGPPSHAASAFSCTTS